MHLLEKFPRKLTTPIAALCAAAALLASAGCIDDGSVEDDSLGVASEELSRSEITTLGGSCVYTPVTDEYACRICVFLQIGPFTIGHKCSYYSCPNNSTADCTEQSEGEDVTLWFEAENGTLTSPMQKVTTGGASTGSSVMVPTTPDSTGGSVKLTFEVPSGGRKYYPWARTSAASTASNAFEYRIDGGGYKLWETPVTGSSWEWSRVFDANSEPGADTGIFLSAGTHTLRFYRREAGTKLDRVMLTTNASFVPSVQSFEAESLPVVAPMQTGATGTSPLATRYRWVPTGSGAGGSFDLNLSVPSDGLYSVWGRINAPTTSQDSFYVGANFGEPALWHLPATTSTTWKWSHVTDHGNAGKVVETYLRADASVNFFRFERREAGAKIDRLIVTNDPSFVPVDAAVPGNTF